MVKKARDKVKTEAQTQGETYGRDQEQQWQTYLASAKVLLALTSLWRRQQAIYDAMKRDRDRIDFNDLEHFCAQILQNEEAAREYRDRLRASGVFSDETEITYAPPVGDTAACFEFRIRACLEEGKGI